MDYDDTPERTLQAEDVSLLAAVVLLPWVFGGVELWAFRSATLLVALAGAIALVRRGWAGWGIARRGSAWLLPAFALLAWALIQLVPLPGSVLERVSPAAHALYAEALMLPADAPSGGVIERMEAAALSRVPEVVTDAADGTTTAGLPLADCLEGRSRPISLQPGATLERAIWFGTLLLAFLLVRARASDPTRAVIYVGALAAGFVALAGVGLLQSWTWDGKLLWLREIPSDRRPFGPYVNRVHFGGVMELAVPMLVGLAIERWRRFGREAISEPIFVLAAVGSATCAVAVVASSSKAAVALVGGALALLALISARGRKARVAVLVALLVLGVVGAGLIAGTGLGEQFGSLSDRAGQGHSLEGRGAVWEAAVSMFRDFPLTGSGFGSFTEVFPRYQPRGASARWTRAHNDYLELALDGGAIAFGLALILGCAFAWRLLRRLAQEGWSPLRTGLALGVASLAGHALVDFNHQIPANALLYVAVAALAVDADLDEVA